MVETEFIERRKFRRFIITVPSTYFRFELNQGTDAQTKDLSCRGIGLIAEEDLPMDTRLNIWIKPPDNEKQILTQGQVKWSNKIDFKKYRIGITLDDTGIKPLPIILRAIQANL